MVKIVALPVSRVFGCLVAQYVSSCKYGYNFCRALLVFVPVVVLREPSEVCLPNMV